AGQWQLLSHEVDERLLQLDHLLTGAAPGVLDVAGKGECPCPQMNGRQRLARPPEQVDDGGHSGDVLEVQVRGIVEVDVRLRRAVDVELPPGGEPAGDDPRKAAARQPAGGSFVL